MRVVISAPRKSGGAQLRCLLAMAYDLKSPPVSAPPGGEPGDVARWLADLPPESVATCDLPLSALHDSAEISGVSLVGVIRHPFDLLVSTFDVAQQRAARGRGDDGVNGPWGILAGQEISSAAVQDYATTTFSQEVAALREWSDSGHAVRYEVLQADPAAALRSVSPRLGELDAEQITHAVGLCPAENVVSSRPGRGRRMPELPPGAWRERLPSRLRETLRDCYADDVAALGYDAG
ncbi:MAG: hypothetical protein KC442_08030 [Thermomicrobiales bacterium]|nr:hypothetical protein [Thermomicrobiales bacterium]